MLYPYFWKHPKWHFVKWSLGGIGTWYKDGEFNSSWIETLREHCLAHLEKNPGRPASLADLHRYVGTSGKHHIDENHPFEPKVLIQQKCRCNHECKKRPY